MIPPPPKGRLTGLGTQKLPKYKPQNFAGRGPRKYTFWGAGGHDCVFVYTVRASLKWSKSGNRQNDLATDKFFWQRLKLLSAAVHHIALFRFTAQFIIGLLSQVVVYTPLILFSLNI